MPAFTFPNSPADEDTYTPVAGLTYTYDAANNLWRVDALESSVAAFNFPASPSHGATYAPYSPLEYTYDNLPGVWMFEPPAIESEFPVYDPATGLTAPVTQIDIDLASVSTGAFSANTLSIHGTNPAGTNTAHTDWTSPTVTYRYATGPSDGETPVFKGKYYSRDHEGYGYNRIGEILLRYTGGRAISAHWNFEGTGSLNITIREGITEGTATPPGSSATATYYIYSTSSLNADIIALVPGYNNSSTNADSVKFKCEGLNLIWYYSLDGTTFTEIVRITPNGMLKGTTFTAGPYPTWLHMQPGTVAFCHINSANHGWRSIGIKYNDTPSVLASGYFTTDLYMTDLGFKEVQTTGSMALSSTTLTVASATGLNLYDWVIVDTAGTASGGARGTRGPGGTYPALYFANATAMNADLAHEQHTLCWLEDTGEVWRLNLPTPGWVRMKTAESNPYVDDANPLALRAQIINKSGTTLTLSLPAQAAVTNTNVYHDNAPIMNNLGAGYIVNPSVYRLNIRFPDSRITCGSLNTFYPKGMWSFIGAGSNVPNSTPTGLTDWWAPHGCAAPELTFAGSNGVVGAPDPVLVANMHFNGGASYLYPQLDFPKMPQAGMFVPLFPGGVFLSLCHGTVVENISGHQIWQKTLNTNACGGVHFRKCYLTTAEPLLTYVQWQFSTNSSNNFCTLTDCEIDGTWIGPGWESFSDAQGGGGTTFTRMVCRNATSSNNSSQDSAFIDCRVLLTENCRYNEGSYSKYNPVVNLNINIGPENVVSTNIQRLVYVMEGYADPQMEQQRGILCDQDDGVTINDCVMEMLPYHASSTMNGAQGIVSSRSNVAITNNRIVGTTIDIYQGNIQTYDAGNTNVTITNNIVDLIVNTTTSPTISGNVNNATTGFDRTPAAISFTAVTDAVAGQQYESNEIQITGINAVLQGALLSSNAKFIWTGGESMADGLIRDHDHWMLTGYSEDKSLIKNGDYMRLVATASMTPSAVVTVTLTVASGVSYNWTITTAAGVASSSIELEASADNFLLEDSSGGFLLE